MYRDDSWIPEALPKAESAADMGLCDHCLGRLFGKMGTGLTNDERGAMLRLALGGIPAHSEPCRLCEDIFDIVPRLAEAAAEAILTVESENFLIGTRVDPLIADRESKIWDELGKDQAEPIKSELNREIGKHALPLINRRVEFTNPQVVALVDTRFANVELDISPVFIYGRYCKLSREIPQTIWPCRSCRGKGCARCHGTGKMYSTSVQEVIGDPARRMADATEHFFHGMGREDIDALMLGGGRPFVLELRSPRIRDIDLDQLEAEVNRSELAKVSKLRFSSKDEVRWVKDASPSKTYRAQVRAEGKVNKERVNEVAKSFKNLHIDQRTPVRVAHRRGDLVRRREILSVEAEVLGDDVFLLVLETESGTYVKEFVSGDEGRTKPSFSERLGVPCVVEALDVMSINDQ
jgi:tRNA pseudouridine synthase 10